VLADEPTGSLDDDNARAAIRQFQRSADAGVTTLAVSHDPRLTAAAHRVLTLADGRIEAADPVAVA
jgi:putative ABC transport system ATP-binding protein